MAQLDDIVFPTTCPDGERDVVVSVSALIMMLESARKILTRQELPADVNREAMNTILDGIAVFLEPILHAAAPMAIELIVERMAASVPDFPPED